MLQFGPQMVTFIIIWSHDVFYLLTISRAKLQSNPHDVTCTMDCARVNTKNWAVLCLTLEQMDISLIFIAKV